MHLIGLHFASTATHDAAGNPIPEADRTGAACRIANVMATLNVTPITNNFYNHSVSGNTAHINGINVANNAHPIGRLSIPNQINGRNVVQVGGLSNRTGITRVGLPDTLTTIASSAFSGCTGLTQISIPASVTSIGSSAFSGCSGLASITLPSSVVKIGIEAFPSTTELVSFGGTRADIDLAIPAGTSSAYINNGWAGFNIVELSITSGVLKGASV